MLCYGPTSAAFFWGVDWVMALYVWVCVYGRYDLGTAHKSHCPWLPFSTCRNTDFSPPGIIIALLKWHCGGNVSRQINMLDDKKIATVCNHVRCTDYSNVIPNGYMIMAFSVRRELSKSVKCNKFCFRFPQNPNFCMASFLRKFFLFRHLKFWFIREKFAWRSRKRNMCVIRLSRTKPEFRIAQ